MRAAVKRASVRGGVLATFMAGTIVLMAVVPPAAVAGAGRTNPPGSGVGVLASPSADAVPPTFPATTPVAAAEQWVAKALAARTTRLGLLTSQIAGERTLSSTERTALTTLVASDVTGIAQLVSSAASATSLRVMQSTATAMIVNFRVFAVVAPAVQAAFDASDQMAAVSSLTALEPAIEAAITADEQPGRSVTRAQAAYRDLTTQLADVASTDQSTTVAVLALRPSSYPGSIAVLAAAQSSLASASTRLVTARADLHRIVQLLAAKGLSTSSRGATSGARQLAEQFAPLS
ncbi:MAG: hypothetical protein JWO62_1797 [Acidimicrobiaceae bacterium]|jgi:hypothetical protein|nr:hypothetical protein [Acidimicrobiaceae bacterium]